MLREVSYYGKMALGLYEHLRTGPAPDAEAEIRRQLEHRESIFLDTVRRVIFSNPDHPYRRMFELAGCRLKDLEEAVRRDGLEKTLAALNREGVFLTNDELKGKTPIVRHGEQIPGDENSFLNPLVKGRLESVSSGSRGKGTRTSESIVYRRHWECYYAVMAREFGLADYAQIVLRPVLPSVVGLRTCFAIVRQKHHLAAWFALGGTWRRAAHYQAMTNALVLLARALGTRIPYPAALPVDDFTPAAELAARWRAAETPCLFTGPASAAVRVAAAAIDRKLDIRGTLFLVSGETLTAAKRAVLEAAGGKVYARYAVSEVGLIGYGCRQMRSGDCVHLNRDGLAAINHRRPAPLGGADVDVLLFTTLLPFAPRLLINAEVGDAGIVEEATCDCRLTRLGFTHQIRDIFSFAKLTGQGMTLMGTDLVRILEEVLPARFGGHPVDYQLVEEEGGSQTRVTLRVSPRVGVTSTSLVKEFFLGQLRSVYGGTLANRVWRDTGGFEAVIAEPYVTHTGKVIPLYLLGPQ